MMTAMEKFDCILDDINNAEIALFRFREAIQRLKNLSLDIDFPIVRKKSDDFMSQLIEVLKKERWNKTRTAKRFGVTRRTVYRWIDEFGLETNKPKKEGK